MTPEFTQEGLVPEDQAGSRQVRDLRVGSDQLLALIDNTSAVIYMRDLDGRYMVVNREYERLFSLHREDIVGLTDHDLFPGEIADAFRANDLWSASNGGPVQMEEVAPGEDGLHTYITDRKRAEEQVRQLNAELEQRVHDRTADLETTVRELDAFAYSVSHDLRA